jgi:argininosuccinate lyase
MFQDALRSLRLLAGAVSSATVDRARLASRAAKDFLTVTELADTLVRSEGMSFREAHGLVATAVRECGSDDTAVNIAQTIKRLHPALKLSTGEVERALDPEHFIRIRTIVGGPAPERTSEALQRAQVQQRGIEEWTLGKLALLNDARSHLLAY